MLNIYKKWGIVYDTNIPEYRLPEKISKDKYGIIFNKSIIMCDEKFNQEVKKMLDKISILEEATDVMVLTNISEEKKMKRVEELLGKENFNYYYNIAKTRRFFEYDEGWNNFALVETIDEHIEDASYISDDYVKELKSLSENDFIKMEYRGGHFVEKGKDRITDKMEIILERYLRLEKKKLANSDFYHDIEDKDFIISSGQIVTKEEEESYLKIKQEGVVGAIEEDLGIKINEFTLPEQLYFLNYIGSLKLGDVDKLKEFVSKYKEKGIRVFLSLGFEKEDSAKHINKILELGEKLPEEVAKKIFSKYTEYVDVVDNAENIIMNIYSGRNIDNSFLGKIKETLLVKGKDILISQYDKVMNNTFDFIKFEEFMENAKADIDLFKNTFKTVFEENKDINFEEFLNLKTNTIKSQDISKEKTQEIKNIIKNNYLDEKLRDTVMESFNKSLKKHNTEISTLERDNKVIACDRLEFNEDGSIYFGTFNVDPKYCSAKIGNAFFKATVSPYIRTHEVKADCSLRQPISAYYIEAGFIGEKIHEYSGEPSLAIRTFPGKEYSSKNLSKEEIIDMFNERKSIFLIESFNIQEDIIKNYPKDKLLTRFFFDSKSKSWFALWE